MALIETLTPILKEVEQASLEIESLSGVRYRHLDSSLCPGMDPPPMTDLWKRFDVHHFGDLGLETFSIRRFTEF